MMDNSQLITKFYTAFSEGKAEEMLSCYHEQVQFHDPAFGTLNSNEARNMWRMLIERSKGELAISFSNVQANEKNGSADWQAEYIFAQTGRKVINKISAEFEFQDGKIIRHTDHFDLWKWTRQAFGLKGYLLGWSSFMRNKIQKQTNGLLNAYMKKRSESKI
jgi:ketosteroid isomerase-like protein